MSKWLPPPSLLPLIPFLMVVGLLVGLIVARRVVHPSTLPSSPSVYHMICAPDEQALNKEVDSYLQQGYRLYGNPTNTYWFNVGSRKDQHALCQAVTKE